MSLTNAQLMEQVQQNAKAIDAIKIRNNRQSAAISKAEGFINDFETNYLTIAAADAMINSALSDMLTALVELNGEEPSITEGV